LGSPARTFCSRGPWPSGACLTAPGATLFPHYIGEVFIAFTELSCKFLKEVHSGDTLYPALEIIELSNQEANGLVTTSVTVFNQRNELVLSGKHKYMLRADL
jgi:acyl dehydratase